MSQVRSSINYKRWFIVLSLYLVLSHVVAGGLYVMFKDEGKVLTQTQAEHMAKAYALDDCNKKKSEATATANCAEIQVDSVQISDTSKPYWTVKYRTSGEGNLMGVLYMDRIGDRYDLSQFAD